MAERILSIQIRLVENTAANNRLLSDLERRVRSAVNPSGPASNARIVNPILALQVAAATQAQNQIRVIQERANADLQRLRQRAENDEARHQQKMLEIATQSTRRRAASQNSTLLGRLSSPIAREAGESLGQSGAIYEQYLTQPLLGIGRAAIKSSLDIDVFRSRLTALEGSAEGANKRLDSLRKLALDSAGVTFKAAADQYALLKGTTDLLPASIERVITSVGKLNAAFKLEDAPRFIRNLQQIYTQNFERPDIKEALGQVPIFNQILERAFGTSDPEQLRKLKAAGKLTAEGYFQGLTDAINSDPRVGNIQENLSARFEKLAGRAQAALEPLGNAVLNVIAPIVERAVPLIEGLGSAFAGLPQPIQLTIIALGGATAALGPFLEIVGATVQALQVKTLAGTIKDLGSITDALSGSAKAAAAAEAAAVASASGWARFASGMTAASSAAKTAATATTAAATGFSLLNPWVLGIAAVVAIAAASTTSYASELDKATQINATSVSRLTEQQKAYQVNISSLKEVAKAKVDTNQAGERLNETLSALDPATRNFANGLSTVEQKANVLTQQLERLKGANETVLRAQQATLIQGAIEAAGKLGELNTELNALGEAQRQYAADVAAVRAQGTEVLGPLTDFGDLLARTNDQVNENSKQTEEYRNKLLNLVPNLVSTTHALGGTTEGLLAQLKASARTQAQIQVLDQVFAPYIKKQQDATTAADQHTQSLLNQANATQSLQDALNALNIQQNPKLAALIVQAAKTGQNAGKLIEQQTKNDAQLKQDIAEGQAVKRAIEQANNYLNPSSGKKTGLVAVAESTAQAVAKLRAEVAALEAGGGNLFDLEIDRERLSATKSQLLEILKLRRELGVSQGERLPNTQSGRESELRLLNLDKRTREEIVKLAEQQAEYEARIAIETARQRSALPTAEQRTALKLAEESNQQREEAIDLDARYLTLQARLFISSSVNQKAAQNAAAAVMVSAQERILAAEKELTVLEAVAEARLKDTNRELEEAALLKEAKAQLLRDEENAFKEIAQINAQLRVGLISNETAIALFRARASLQRVQDEQRTVASIRDLEEQLEELRSGKGVEAALNRSREARLQGEKQTLEQLITLRAEDKANFTQTEEFKRGVLERAELSRRQAARQTAEEIISLQNEIAHAAEGAADRYQLAYLRAVRNIQQEDEQANVRLIENQLQLARQTEIRYDRLNDKVIELLASQKGLTETFQDFRANVVEDTLNLLDKATDKITKRFGVMGDSVKQLIKDLLRLAATKVFQQILGLSPQQAPQGAPGFSLGGLLQPGASRGGSGTSFFGVPAVPGNTFGGVPTLLNFPGIGPGGTGTFTGAPVSFGGAGGATSQVGGLRGLINQFTGFPIFGARAAAVTPQIVGGLPVLPGVQVPGLSAPAGAPSITGVGTTAASAAAPSLFASLGATGLLAGGGLLGSLAGGKSPTGRLLGGIGGSLGAGFIGASGLLGGGIQAALPALLSNPITAIIAGGLIGTALIVRAFANRDLKKLASTIKEVHQVDVPVKGEGLGLLKQIKEIGQQQYGKKWLDQRADLVKQQSVIDILTTYAVGTGQNNSPLVKAKRLADPFNDANNFVRRLNGGPIPGPTLGRDYVPALLDGNEYVSAARTVQREGVASFAALNAGLATITPKAANNAEMSALRTDVQTALQQNAAMNALVIDVLARIKGIPADHVLSLGLDTNPNLLADALSRLHTGGNLYAFTDKLTQ